MKYLLIFFLSLLFTIFSTPFIIPYLKKRNIIDNPGGRRVHSRSTPRMGGIIILFITSIIILSFYNNINDIRLFLLGALIIAIVGISDDIVGINYKIKFLLQIVVAFLIILQLDGRIENIKLLNFVLPPIPAYILLFLFIIGTINAINLMDGLDGLAGGFSLLIFASLLALALTRGDVLTIVVSASLLGSLLGFLKFNAYPAQIFLGDTGSLTLGYFLVFFSMKVSGNFTAPNEFDLTFPIILLGVPIVDTLKVMFVRIKNGKNPFHPDKNHLHHIIFGSRLSHKYVVFIIQGFSLLFIITSFLYLKTNHIYVVIFFIVLSILFVSGRMFVRRFSQYSLISKVSSRVSGIPAKLFLIFKNPLILISWIAFFVLVLTTFPKVNPLKLSYIMVLIFFGILLLGLSIYYKGRNNIVSQIYVLMNFTVFFIVFNFIQNHWNGVESDFLIDSKIVFYLALAVISFVIVLFLLARERILPKNEMFLSGLDLIIPIFIALGFIIQNFMDIEGLNIITSSLVLSFTCYLWYKVVTKVNNNLLSFMYYGSFGLPLITLLILMTY